MDASNIKLKNKLGLRHIFISILLFLSWNLCSGQNDCDLKISKDSIFVYTCKNPTSNLKAIKCNFTIRTTLSKLAGYILDVPAYTQWQYNTIESDLVKVISENEIIYRAVVHAPWPVTDRELVVKVKITQDPSSKIMTVRASNISSYLPENNDYVRIKESFGAWIVTPQEDGLLKVVYSFKVDPGGSIPAWLLNLAIAEGPYQTFKNLIDRNNSKVPVIPATFIQD